MTTKISSSRTPAAAKFIKVHMTSTGEVEIELTNVNPKTAELVSRALPFASEAQRWGDEIYFKIPVKAPEEKSQTVVEVGDVAYWPPGESMCIFFGPTPVSKAGEPRAYSPVNVFGKIVGSPLVFRKIKNGEKIEVERK
ncbi:MAG: cyclophilin-like fold protein [Promethearchaeati archaeon SRVP18_Atabeyarchaeia-1]